MNKVIYHANCNDGFCAAFLFWLKFKDTAEYIPMNYSQVLDLSRFGPLDDIYIVDFSFSREVTLAIAERVKTVTVLDHHKTAQKELSGDFPSNCDIQFNMENSGARLASWYLGIDKWFVAYVEDRDLWKWEQPNSREINAYLSLIPQTFEAWNKLTIENLNDYLKAGETVLRYERKLIDKAKENAVLHDLTGTTYSIPAVNSTILFSDIAGELAEGYPFAVAWFMRKDGKYQYSLRSSKEGIDVSALARTFGGGGHPNAAGFESDTLLLTPTLGSNLVGRTIRMPDGLFKVFGYAPRGNRQFQPELPACSWYVTVYEVDEQGNRISDNYKYFSDKEIKKWIQK